MEVAKEVFEIKRRSTLHSVVQRLYGCCNFMRVLSLNWNYGMCSARYTVNDNTHIKLQHPYTVQSRKMRLASESAEEEEIRLSRRQSRDRAKRAVQSSQTTKKCRGSETAEARERTDRDRRKSRLDSESAKEKDTRYR